MTSVIKMMMGRKADMKIRVVEQKTKFVRVKVHRQK